MRTVRPAAENGDFLIILIAHNDIIKSAFATPVPLRRDGNKLVTKVRGAQKFD